MLYIYTSYMFPLQVDDIAFRLRNYFVMAVSGTRSRKKQGG
jgi:hypothetical protein